MEKSMTRGMRIFSVTLAGLFVSLGFAGFEAQAAGINSSAVSQSCVDAVVLDNNASVEKGASNVKLIEVKITNRCSEDVIVLGMGFMGNFGSKSAENPSIWVDGVNYGKPDQFKSYGVNYVNRALRIAKGSSKNVMLKGDISEGVTSKALSFRFNSCPHVFLVNGAATGNKVKFKVSGKSDLYVVKKPVAAVQTQALNAVVLANDAKVEKGAKSVKLIEVKLTNTGTEDLAVSGIGFMGDFSPASISNVGLYVDGVNTGKVGTIKSYGIVYDSLNLKIASGKSASIVLKGDISKTVKSKAMSFRLDSCPHVFTVKGVNSGNKAKVSISGKSYIYFVQK